MISINSYSDEFLCNVCNTMYRSRSGIRKHQRIHHNLRGGTYNITITKKRATRATSPHLDFNDSSNIDSDTRDFQSNEGIASETSSSGSSEDDGGGFKMFEDNAFDISESEDELTEESIFPIFEHNLNVLMQNVISLVGDLSKLQSDFSECCKQKKQQLRGACEQQHEDIGLCRICLDGKTTHIFTGCGHFVLCGDCAEMIRKSGMKCPICMAVSPSIVKVYQ